LLACYEPLYCVLLSLNERHGSRYGHRFLDIARLQIGIDRDLVIYVQGNVVHDESLESGLFDCYRVRSDQQQSHRVFALVAGSRPSFFPGRLISYDNRGARNHRPRAVPDKSSYSGGDILGPRRSGGNSPPPKQRKNTEAPPFYYQKTSPLLFLSPILLFFFFLP